MELMQNKPEDQDGVEETVESSGGQSVAQNNFLPISIFLAAVMISGSILYTSGRSGAANPKAANNPSVPQLADIKTLLAVSERDVILGDQNAPVTFIEYGDFQCPFCGRFFSQVEPQLKEEYVKTGKVKMIYRDMAFLGPESVETAKAAECAKDQGKFWQYHDELFTAEIKDGKEGNGNLNRALFLQIAKSLAMDVNTFTSCYDGAKYASVVDEATANARNGGVNATPTSFVNGTVVQGAQPYEAFKAAIDTALAAR